MSAISVYDRGVTEYAKWEDEKLGLDTSAPRSSITESVGDISSMDEMIWEAIFQPEDSGLKRFLPLDKLETLMNRRSLESLLEGAGFASDEVVRMTSTILGETEPNKPESRTPGLKRIFAILVMVGRIQAIEKFIRHGIDDSVLPVKIRAVDHQSRQSGLKHVPRCETKSRFDNSKIEDCLWGFSKKDLGHFDMYQQEIHVPFFSFSGDHGPFCFYDLDSECVLPFINMIPGEAGGNGKVSKVQIHPAHHNYVDPRKKKEDIYFAWKKLIRDDCDEFRQEVENLERLSAKRGHRDDHLMHLELACRHGKDCYLVFPWADGDLTQFWRHENRSRDCSNHDDVIWFFDQCLGLSTGLRRLHDLHSFERPVFGADGCYRAMDLVAEVENDKLYGRHGDIKPENILWFRDYNGHRDHLMITDFGLTKFHSRDSRSQPGSGGLAGTDTYQPPEVFLTKKVTRKYDVWSLGCVFVEFVSWFFLDGVTATENFATARLPETNEAYRPDTFFDIECSGTHPRARLARVKPGVLKWFQKIRDLEYCPRAVDDFLQLILDSMLQPQVEKRFDSATVCTELQKIFERCQADKSYAVNDCSVALSSTTNWIMQEPEEFNSFKTEEIDFPVVSDQMVSDNQEFEKGKPRISPESAAADIDIDTPDAQFEPDWGNEDSEWGITMSNLEAVIRDLAQRKGEQVECGKRNLEVSILP
uniref:Protein kinase domain-containing protein n=1 Tax=Bionectria ochroleuca TaxID=29856 RepID=A0A8H7KAB5_BIOOC